MIITLQQLCALTPLVIIGVTLLTVMLSIACKRNHLTSAILTIMGLSLAALSLIVVKQNIPTDITILMHADKYSIIYAGLTLVSSIVISIQAYAWLNNYSGNREEFYLLLLIASMGGIVLTYANHLASLFLGIELTALPLFGMIGYSFSQKYALEASIKYTLLSATASAFLMFGMAMIYADTGHLDLNSIGMQLNNSLNMQSILLAGLGMVIVGIGFKLSLAPFHLWTPDVYQGASVPVAAFLTTVGKIPIFAVIIRLFLYSYAIYNDTLKLIMIVIAFISILLGHTMVLNQNSIKRILGYSSIANLGYLLIGIIADRNYKLALECINICAVSYVLASLCVFSIVSVLTNQFNRENTDSIYFYYGLFWRKPISAIAMTFAMLSLAGVPITLGFIGKLYLVTIILNNHLNCLLIPLALGGAVSLFYYSRIIISLYFLPVTGLIQSKVSNWALTVNSLSSIFLSLLILLLGLHPQPLIDLT